MRTQYGALCYRVKNDKTEVLLITSRDTGRWLIPKGWPVDGLAPYRSAEQEAWEEAGVEGRTNNIVLGVYTYDKSLGRKRKQPCAVAVFPLKVKRLADKFPEAGQRKLKWFPLRKAAGKVTEPELAALIKRFKPSKLPR